MLIFRTRPNCLFFRLIFFFFFILAVEFILFVYNYTLFYRKIWYIIDNILLFTFDLCSDFLLYGGLECRLSVLIILVSSVIFLMHCCFDTAFGSCFLGQFFNLFERIYDCGIAIWVCFSYILVDQEYDV
jgi:hypothetical protein